MRINYTQYGTGKKKILISINLIDDPFYSYKSEISNINKNNEYSFYFLEKNQYYSLFKFDLFGKISFKNLDKTYKNNHYLKDYYNNLIKFLIKEKITKILIFGYGRFRHPEFLKQLKKNNIELSLFTVDDDYSTIRYCSLPYTKYYDYHFHVGIMFDKYGKTIADELKDYGGNPIWIPYGYFKDHLNDNIDFYNRDIDICYIGNINIPKLIRLSKLKRHFGDKLKLFGQQGNGDWKSLKGIFYKITNKIFSLGYIEPVSDERLKEIYKRTKIGFNLHLCPRKGPSNLRLYELPANGIMEICDNDLGMRKIYNVGKEVITYRNISDAIKKIEYYLQHEEERIYVAKQGFKKTVNNYSFENCLMKMFNIMFKGTTFCK